MNIEQKLVEIRKSCEYLQKENSGYQFKYVSSSQTLGALRKAMDDQQVLLVPRVTSVIVQDHATKRGDHGYFTQMFVEFTWVNAEDPKQQVVCPWYGQGLDDGEKGVGKALTYAEKFFLLKFFNIATDKDDPDAFQKGKDDEPKEKKKEDKAPPARSEGKTEPPGKAEEKAPEKPKPMQKAQGDVLKVMMTKAGITSDEEQKAFFAYAIGPNEKTFDFAHKFISRFKEYLEAYSKMKGAGAEQQEGEGSGF